MHFFLLPPFLAFLAFRASWCVSVVSARGDGRTHAPWNEERVRARCECYERYEDDPSSWDRSRVFNRAVTTRRDAMRCDEGHEEGKDDARIDWIRISCVDSRRRRTMRETDEGYDDRLERVMDEISLCA